MADHHLFTWQILLAMNIRCDFAGFPEAAPKQRGSPTAGQEQRLDSNQCLVLLRVVSCPQAASSVLP